MKFKYDLEKQSGVKVGYWVIDEIKISPVNGKAEAKLYGYLSEETYLAGKLYEIENHVYFNVDKEETKFKNLVTALSQVIENKMKEPPPSGDLIGIRK